MASAEVQVVVQAWKQASMRLNELDASYKPDSIPSTAKQLLLLARSQHACFGCLRRKKIGIAVCWKCWDTGRPTKITNGVGASVYETMEEEEHRQSMEEFYATPLSQIRALFPEWVGLHDETYIPLGKVGTYVTGKRHTYENRTLLDRDQVENPEYQPLGTSTASVLLCGARSDELVNEVRFMHSNVYRRQEREGTNIRVPINDVRSESPSLTSPSRRTPQQLLHSSPQSRRFQKSPHSFPFPQSSPVQPTQPTRPTQPSPSSLQLSSSLWSKSNKRKDAEHPLPPRFQSLPNVLTQQRTPMILLHSSNRAASHHALSRLLQVVVALASRSHIFVRNCPIVQRREALMFKCIARMRHQKMYRMFLAMINNVFENQRRRRLQFEANKRCMRIFRQAQSRCFDAWHTLASRNAKGLLVLKKRLGGIKLRLYSIWKKKWAENVRAQECEAQAKAFIMRYKYQTACKCLLALHESAVGQIKLRKYIKRWLNMKLLACIESWRDLVVRNQRVRAFIRKQLQGIRDYCFECWHDNVKEELAHRKKKLQTAMFRFRNRTIVASFAGFVKYWELGLASREVQRTFRGFCARVNALQFKQRTLELETNRHTSEELEISQLVDAVQIFQATVWSEDSLEAVRLSKTSVKNIKHNYREEAFLRENAHRIPSAVAKRQQQVDAGGAGAVLHKDDMEEQFNKFDSRLTGCVATADLEELLWTILRRPASIAMLESGTNELSDPFTVAGFCEWIFAQPKQEVAESGQCHIGTLRNRKSLQTLELREIGRAATLYAVERARVLGRYLYRFKEDAAPRYECKKCRHGFRFPNQLKKHAQTNLCRHSNIPMTLKGTVAFNEAKELVESGIFPKLDQECTSRPQLNALELRYFKPECTFNGQEKKGHVRIPIAALEHVRSGDARVGDDRPVLLVTEHVKVQQRSRTGVKKVHKKVYHSLVLKDVDAYNRWKNILKVLCGKNKQQRRFRNEQRDREREARRIKRAKDLAARSDARRKQFAEESKEKAVARRLAEKKERDAVKRARDLAIANKKMKAAAKRDELVAAKRNIGQSHLISQAHAFIAGTDEASEALALAELGLLPSSDEEDEWEMNV